MCRMIGIKNYRFREQKEILENFSVLAENGKIPEGSAPGHHDGWGIGYYKQTRAVLYKSASSIVRERDIFRRLIRDADGSPTLLLHLRKSAWPRTSTAENAHPFIYGNFMFAHNGTIRDFKKLLPHLGVDKKASEIKRALDTEIFFYFIMSCLPLGIKKAFRHSIKHICRENSYSSLNCLLATGKGLFAFRQYSLSPSYYSLYHARAGGSDIICSEPVGGTISWNMVRKGALLAL